MPELIIALDCDFGRAINVIEQTTDVCGFYKLGIRAVYDYRMAVMPHLRARAKRVMLDAKLYDTPDTIAAVMDVILSDWKPDLLTVRPESAAVAYELSRGTNTRILTVPRLTSDRPPALSVDYYLQFASHTDGFVCPVPGALSARESLRRAGSATAIIVCPGVRLADHGCNDHKVSSTPIEAAESNVDFVVVGRPVIFASNPQKIVTDYIKSFTEGSLEVTKIAS